VFFHQLESSFVQSGATNSHFPVEVTDGHMRPVVVFEKLNSARYHMILHIVCHPLLSRQGNAIRFVHLSICFQSAF